MEVWRGAWFLTVDVSSVAVLHFRTLLPESRAGSGGVGRNLQPASGQDPKLDKPGFRVPLLWAAFSLCHFPQLLLVSLAFPK